MYNTWAMMVMDNGGSKSSKSSIESIESIAPGLTANTVPIGDIYAQMDLNREAAGLRGWGEGQLLQQLSAMGYGPYINAWTDARGIDRNDRQVLTSPVGKGTYR